MIAYVDGVSKRAISISSKKRGEEGQKAFTWNLSMTSHLSTACDLGRCWTLQLMEGQLKVGISTTDSVSHHPYWGENSH